MFDITKVGDVAVIKLSGRVDVQAALELEKEMNNILSSGFNKIVFDMNDVQHLSSSGIRVLISTLRRTMSNNGWVRLARVNQAVKKILKLVELENLFTYYENVDNAIKDVK
jgi:anti-sigma B factor antagonist